MENRNIQIKLVVSKKEREQIERNAKVCDRTVSAYIREVALNMCFLELNYDCVMDHTHEISSYKNAIYQLVFTIKKMGNYTPADLEYIVNATNEILESENEFLNLYDKSVESEKKLLARTVRKVVKENIEKGR